MRKLLLAATLLFAVPAHADLVTIQLSADGGSFSTFPNIPITGMFGQSYGGWTVYARETGGPGTQGFEVNLFNSAPGSLWVVITSQNNTSPTGLQDFFSETRLIANIPADWFVVDQLWFDPNNGLGFTGFQLTDPILFHGPGVVDVSSLLDYGSGPYSMTALFAVSAPSCCGNAYSDINTNASVAVPGPVAGAGLPGLAAMLLGLLGLHRRRKLAEWWDRRGCLRGWNG